MGYNLWNLHYLNRKEWFERFGIPAVAEIVSAEQTGVYVNNLPQIKLKLNIYIEGRSPYLITYRKVFDIPTAGQLIPGARFPVLVHPEKPNKIFIG